MSELSKSLDKLFNFVTNAQMGFVMIFFLAIYPVFMWGAIASGDIPKSIAYNVGVLKLSTGLINTEKLVVGNRYCVGDECVAYLTPKLASQISNDAISSIPKNLIGTLIGTLFIMLSASFWVALLVGVKGNSKLILIVALIMSLPAAVAIAGPDQKMRDIRFCSKPLVEIEVPPVLSGLGLDYTKANVPICQHI